MDFDALSWSGLLFGVGGGGGGGVGVRVGVGVGVGVAVFIPLVVGCVIVGVQSATFDHWRPPLQACVPLCCVIRLPQHCTGVFFLSM